MLAAAQGYRNSIWVERAEVFIVSNGIQIRMGFALKIDLRMILALVTRLYLQVVFLRVDVLLALFSLELKLIQGIYG